MQLSEDQIIKLAPDAASVKAGKGLASAAKWVLRGAGDRALWGHCQGSGKNPYNFGSLVQETPCRLHTIHGIFP